MFRTFGNIQGMVEDWIHKRTDDSECPVKIFCIYIVFAELCQINMIGN